MYKAGITRTPSDFLCEDGELAECVNMTTDHEELKPVVQPKQEMTDVPGTLVYVHRYNNEKRYIVRDGNAFKWGKKADGAYSNQQELFSVTGEVKVTAIGKILIFTTDEGLKYCMWKATTYTVFDKIPEPEVEFVLSKRSANGDVSLFSAADAQINWEEYVESTAKYTDILNVGIGNATIADQLAYNDLIIGLYSKHKKNISDKKGFCLPFFVRTAVELYDGSFTYISQPVLLFPSVTHNSYIAEFNSSGETFKFRTSLAYLYYRSNYDYSEWNDIVKGVTVFISAPIEINDIWTDLPDPEVIPALSGVKYDKIVGRNYLSVFESEFADNQNYTFWAFKKRDELEVKNEITSASVFYKLCKIGLVGTGMSDEHNGWKAMDGLFEKRTLETLTTQDQLKKNDFYSRCSLQADMLYAYNSRLNIAGIKRGFFKGYSFFLPYDNDNEYEYTALVRIKTDSGNRIVKKVWRSKQKQGIWFYYPDPRAEYVTIWKYINPWYYCCLDAKLTECAGLNGAFYFRGVPTSGYADTVTPSESAIPHDETEVIDVELIPNQIATSEVYNPLVFNTYNTVGTGRILAMATQTVALSQGKFGECPLIVFTDMGLWGMSVDNTGLYEDAKPMPREVCINPNSILETDGAVFFVSKKGLMVIVGKDVRCVSWQMNGQTFDTDDILSLSGQDNPAASWATIISACQGDETFLDYIRDEKCMMAYDYIESRIMIINNREVNSSPKYGFSYVYNIADGTVSKSVLPFQPSADAKSVVSDYPDYLIHSGSVVYTLYGKQREEEITARQKAFLLTRPMKLSGPVSVKSLRELVNVGSWSKKNGSGVKTQVYVSDNLEDWYKIESRFGAAVKYFRIALYINMLPIERLSGTILFDQERRNNNARV